MSLSGTQRYTIVIIYFLITCVLFCLPGSAFPEASWLDNLHPDKWIHIGIFTLLTLLVSWAIPLTSKKGLVIMFLIAICYGILVEFVQDRFIPNRSFDLGDWGADIIGSFTGVWLWSLMGIKK
jgi:hypothetical protein